MEEVEGELVRLLKDGRGAFVVAALLESEGGAQFGPYGMRVGVGVGGEGLVVLPQSERSCADAWRIARGGSDQSVFPYLGRAASGRTERCERCKDVAELDPALWFRFEVRNVQRGKAARSGEAGGRNSRLERQAARERRFTGYPRGHNANRAVGAGRRGRGTMCTLRSR